MTGCDRMRQERDKVEMHHDNILMTHGLGHVTRDTPDGLPEVPVFTFFNPISSDTKLSEKYLKSLRKYQKESKIVRIGENIKKLEEPTEKKFLSKTFHRMWYYGQNTTQKLCSGHRKQTTNEKCLLLHYKDPYLVMGPFKYELLSSDPHVGMFRDFMSSVECDSVVTRSRTKIKSTPFEARGRTQYYTTQRVSKRVHITEEQFELAHQSSERISLATNWIVHQEQKWNRNCSERKGFL